jgi:hypothetical protein
VGAWMLNLSNSIEKPIEHKLSIVSYLSRIATIYTNKEYLLLSLRYNHASMGHVREGKSGKERRDTAREFTERNRRVRRQGQRGRVYCAYVIIDSKFLYRIILFIATV